MTTERGISTVLDVSVALLLISASVLMLFVFLEQDDQEPEPVQADRSAETVASTTVNFSYSTYPAAEQAYTDDNNGNDPWGDHVAVFEAVDSDLSDDDVADAAAYERAVHGPIAGLAADAAVTNVEFWGHSLTHEGQDFEAQLDEAVKAAFANQDIKVRVDAVWRPYPDSEIVGEASAGPYVPADADVSSAVIEVPSGMAIDEDALAEAREDGRNDPTTTPDFNNESRLLAYSIVDRLFPSEEMQRAIERPGVDRALAVHRYQRMSAILNEESGDLGWIGGALHHYPFYHQYLEHSFDISEEGEIPPYDTLFLNNQIVASGGLALDPNTDIGEGGLAALIYDELQDEIDLFHRHETSGDEFVDEVSIDYVEVTVRVWETEDATEPSESEP